MYVSSLIVRIFLCALLLLPVIANADPALAQSKKQNIECLMKYSHENGFFNGSILVAEHGKVIYSNAFGLANEKMEQPLTTASQFYLASVSKQFTAMAIMILKERGKLSFQDKLSKFLPDFPAYAEGITIEHLLTHTSGMADPFQLGMYKSGLKNHEVLNRLIQQESLEFTPGEKYSYSNGGYIILALIVEKASGQPFNEFMHKTIFHPLKMSSTLVYDESKPAVVNRVIGYDESGKIDDYNLLTYGAGGIYSTVEDLFKWDRALYEHRLVTNRTLEKAFSPFKLTDAGASNYGYGWHITKDELRKTVFHTGFMGGFRTMIDRQLDKENTIIMLTNRGNSFSMDAITLAIKNILDGKDFDFPVR